MATFQRVQRTLEGAVYAPARKDINADFPLRGFVGCDDCGELLTSRWSKSRNKLYPYDLCDTLGCASKRKSIPRAKIDDGAEAILRKLGPAWPLVDMARAMFTELWQFRLSQSEQDRGDLQKQITDVETQFQALLDRIVEASSNSVINAYEARIAKLEREKLILVERSQKLAKPRRDLSEVTEPALKLSNRP